MEVVDDDLTSYGRCYGENVYNYNVFSMETGAIKMKLPRTMSEIVSFLFGWVGLVTGSF